MKKKEVKVVSVLDEINDMLALIKDSEIVAPSNDFDGEVLGTLTASQKRLWCLMGDLAKKADPLVKEHNALGEKILAAFGGPGGTSPRQALIAAGTPGIKEAIERQEEIAPHVRRLQSISKIVWRIFWHDVRITFGTFDDKNLRINFRWEVVRLFSQEGLDLPAGLAAILSGRGRMSVIGG